MTTPNEYLSAAGERRKEEILRAALQASGRRRRRRQMAIGGAVLIPLLMLAIVGLDVDRQKPEPAVVVLPPSPMVRKSRANVMIDRIATDPGIADRLSVGDPAPKWKIIGDDELLQSMADAGSPTGLVELNGRRFFLPR